MTHGEYIDALSFCFRTEAAGAIAGEVAMLLRSDADQRHKLDVFRRIEASNRILCLQELRRNGIARPTVDRSYYRIGYQLGLRLGDGEWGQFLDRFEATIHPEVFERYLAEAGVQGEFDFDVNASLLEHLARHERSLQRFVMSEREGCCADSTAELETVLHDDLCAGLVGPDDPVGW